MARIVWNEAKTIGIIINMPSEPEDEWQLAYELRKGALNCLGLVTGDFVEAWAEMTADDNCTIEELAS